MMTRTWWIFPCVVAAIWLLSGILHVAHAQLLSQDSERPMLVGARSVSLAEANLADISDVSVMYWNPGALGLLENVSVVFDEYYEMRTAINNDNAAVAIPHVSEGTLALGASVCNVGYIKLIQPYNYQAVEYGVDIAYAANLSPGFGVGFRMHSQFGHTINSNMFTNDWSFGLVYSPSSEVSYGLVCSGLGEGLRLIDSVSLAKEALARRLEVGVTMHYPASRNNQFLTVSVSNEKIFGESGLYYKTGIELLPVNFIALRYGFVVGPDFSTPRYGIGLKTNYIHLDYVIAPSYMSTRFQQITLSINL
jgi:hypothetical protein